jgi:hypothetical protein
MKNEPGIEIAEWTEGGDANFTLEITTDDRKEVFEGENERELIERLGIAKAKATQMIRALTAENKKLRGIIARLKMPQVGPLTNAQQDAINEILATFQRIAGLKQRSS